MLAFQARKAIPEASILGSMPDHDLQHAEAFGVLIRTAREARGWTQDELGMAIGGMRANHISKIERGRAFPPKRTRQRIAEALGIPLRDLDAEPARPATHLERFPNRTHAEAVYREEAAEHGEDPELVERAIAATRAIDAAVIDPSLAGGDAPIKKWVKQMAYKYAEPRAQAPTSHQNPSGTRAAILPFRRAQT